MSYGLTHILDSRDRQFLVAIFNRATYSRCKILIEYLNSVQNWNVTIGVSSSLLMHEFGEGIKYIQKENKKVKFELLPIDKFESNGRGITHATAAIARSFADLFSENHYDACFVVGDRFETMGVALAAAFANVPLAHVQGGEVTGNIDEKIRHAVTKLSDYHFAATALSKRYILAMGEEKHRVFHTGCPSIDVIQKARIKRHRSKEKYIICQFHPHTKEQDKAYEQTEVVLDSVLDFCNSEGFRCYWYFPNPDPGRNEIIKLLEDRHREYKHCLTKAINRPPEDFLQDLAGCAFIIGNSSSGIREASYIGVPAINVGDRQSIRERSGNVIDCDFNMPEIIKAMHHQLHTFKYPKSILYGDGRASQNIAQAILGIDFSIKDHLTYPLLFQYQPQHFGEARIEFHRKHRPKPAKTKNATCIASAV